MRTIRITKGLGCSVESIRRNSRVESDRSESIGSLVDGTEAVVPQTITYSGKDYKIIRPELHVDPGSRVNRLDTLITDRKNPYLRILSGVSGTVTQVELGHRRTLQKLVIATDADCQESQAGKSTGDTFPLPDSVVDNLNSGDSARIKAGLVEAGLFQGFRTRPYHKLPTPNSTPQHIFVTAMDTNPLAPDVFTVLANDTGFLESGLRVIESLTEGSVYICQPPGPPLVDIPSGKIETVSFEGPHPAGNSGTHVQMLFPVDRQSVVWTIDYQEVVAMGKALSNGELSTSRTISVSDIATDTSLLIRAIPGADIRTLISQTGIYPNSSDEGIQNHTQHGNTQPVQHSYWSGNLYAGSYSSFLRSFDRQVFVFPRSEKIPYPAAGVVTQFFRWLKNHLNSAPPLLAEPWMDELTPLTDSPVTLLRALSCSDVEAAEASGCLRFAEEDIQALTILCGNRYDFKKLLAECTESIEDDYLMSSSG